MKQTQVKHCDGLSRVITKSNEEQQMLGSETTKVPYTVQNEVRFDKQQEEAEEARWLWMVLQVSIEVNTAE